jgi:hypothetical protein
LGVAADGRFGLDFDLLERAQGGAHRFDFLLRCALLLGEGLEESLRFGQLADDLAQVRLDGVDLGGEGLQARVGFLVFAGRASDLA